MIVMLSVPIYAAETWSNGTISSKTYSSSENINLTGNVTLNGGITINSGVTLTVQGNGKIMRGDSYTGVLFTVNEGGTLIIKGNNGNKDDIIIDGNENVISQGTMILTGGDLQIENITLCNNKNRAKSSAGGAMYIYATGSLEVNNCLITKNTACAFGGAFYSAGNIEITDSEISYNRAMTTVTATSSGLGRGGGFLLTGEEVYRKAY